MSKAKIIIVSLLAAVAGFVGYGLSQGDIVNAETRECGDNSIIRCGVMTASELKTAYNKNERGLKKIYTHYGISAADIASAGSAKSGYVNTDGTVTVDGKVVATGAKTVGRSASLGGSKVKISDSLNVYEGSNRLKSKLAVFVFFNTDGTYKAAIIKVCGNPVPATPKPVPVYKCDSLTAKAVTRNEYNFTTAATAKNGAKIVNYTYDFGDGKTATTGNTTSHTYAKAGTYTVTVKVNVTVDGKSVTAPTCKTTVKVAEEVKPVYKCDSLTSKKISRNEYEFTTAATAKDGATIVNYAYDFGDGKTATTTNATTTHAYANAGTYKVSVKVTVKVDGKEVTAPGTCETTVTVEKENCPIPGKEQYPKDSPECKEDKPAIDITKVVNDAEHAKVTVGEEFTYKIVVYNRGDVALKDAVVTDKAPTEVTLLKASEGTISGNTWTHTIAELKVGESKTYTITAKYATYATGTHKNTVCVDTPTVPGTPDDCDDATTETTEDIKVCDTNDNTIKTIDRSEFDESHMTTDLSKCDKPEEKCEVPGKEHLPANSPDCKEDEQEVTELPRTGMAENLVTVLGAGSLVTAGAAYLASRRHA